MELPTKETFEVPCCGCMSGYYSTGKINSYECRPNVQTLTIGSIRIDTNDKNQPIEYMCNETGVGSGSIYPERNLYSNYEDAYTASIDAAKEYIKMQEDTRKEKMYDSRGRLRAPTSDQKRIRTLEKELKKFDKNSPLLRNFSEESV